MTCNATSRHPSSYVLRAHCGLLKKKMNPYTKLNAVSSVEDLGEQKDNKSNCIILEKKFKIFERKR